MFFSLDTFLRHGTTWYTYPSIYRVQSSTLANSLNKSLAESPSYLFDVCLSFSLPFAPFMSINKGNIISPTLSISFFRDRWTTKIRASLSRSLHSGQRDCSRPFFICTRKSKRKEKGIDRILNTVHGSHCCRLAWAPRIDLDYLCTYEWQDTYKRTIVIKLVWF